MQIDNEFVVNAPIDQVWSFLLDVERIAPCAPGAELTEVVDDRTWKGKMNVKVGPVAMSFAGTVTLQDRDDTARRAVLKAEGREQRGRGAASALVTASLEEEADGTKVSIVTDLTISGAAAQYGRGMIGDVSKRLTGQFASCLQTNMAAQETSRRTPESTGEEQATQPVKGFRLAVWALWRAIVRALRRLFVRAAG
jgi:carbon monoxide dehydrogenase subunit G